MRFPTKLWRCRARLVGRRNVPAGLREDAYLVVLALDEQQVIEIDARSMDVRRAAGGGGADGEWVGRRNLVQILEERCVAVGGLVVKGCNEGTDR